MAKRSRRGASRNIKARRMSYSPVRNRRLKALPKWILAAAAAVIIFLAIFLPRIIAPGKKSIGENAVSTAVSPFQEFFTNATNWAVNLIESGRNYNDLSKEYSEIKRENEALKLEISSYAEEAAENERLTALLGAYEHYTAYSPVYAKVIARDPGPWFSTFTLNAGTSKGIQADMAVVTGDGLVGRVTNVGLNSCTVVSIIDSSSSVACLVQRTRDNGILHGVTKDTDAASACYVYYLPSTSDAAIGDTVITSGVDTKYPKGLPIGSVTEVSRKSDAADSYIVVTPYADFSHIEEVLILAVSTTGTNADAHAKLFTPTPSPTKEASDLVINTPSPEPTVNPENDSEIWYYPTALPASLDPSDMGDVESGWADGTVN